eukprot:scaffold8641_cov85-Cylindrotheca_fusiformis.AAC.2
MLLDQIVSRSFDRCMFGRKGSPTGCRGLFVAVVEKTVVRDWNARESKILVTPGGHVTGNGHFRGRKVDVGECLGGWVLNATAGNSGM